MRAHVVGSIVAHVKYVFEQLATCVPPLPPPTPQHAAPRASNMSVGTHAVSGTWYMWANANTLVYHETFPASVLQHRAIGRCVKLGWYQEPLCRHGHLLTWDLPCSQWILLTLEPLSQRAALCLGLIEQWPWTVAFSDKPLLACHG